MKIDLSTKVGLRELYDKVNEDTVYCVAYEEDFDEWDAEVGTDGVIKAGAEAYDMITETLMDDYPFELN